MGDNQKRAYLNRRHKHTDKDDFRTPMYIIKWLKSKFGDGLRDGACSPGINNKGEPINVFGFHLISKNEWVYINPPFDTPTILRFIESCVDISKGNNVVFLLPNKLCQKSFCLNVNQHFDEIIMLGGRIDFESPYAVKGGSSMNGCFIGIMYCDPIKKNTYPIVKSITLSKLKEDYA